MRRLAHNSPLPLARIPLWSQHLRGVSPKPAVSNINYRQDIATLCMDTNRSDSVAAHHATHLKHETKVAVKETLTVQTFPEPLSCHCRRAAASGPPPPAFSASPALIRPIGFTSSHPLPQLKSGGHPRSGLPMCDDCEPRRDSPLFFHWYVGGASWTSLLWWNADREQRADRIKERIATKHNPIFDHPSTSAYRGESLLPCGVFAHLIHSLPSNCSSTLYETLLSNRRLLSRFT